MRISDWSSDVCSSDLRSHARAMLVEAAWAAAKTPGPLHAFFVRVRAKRGHQIAAVALARKLTVLCWHLLTKETDYRWARPAMLANTRRTRSEEHTSELQSLMRISYAVFCLKQKTH